MESISIIMPVYNAEKYIEATLLSVINQTIKINIELIVINDGSTDNSIKILEKYKKEYPSIISLVNKKNTGVSDSRNIGLKMASGEYITFIDSDDIYEINYLEKMYNAIKKGYDLVSCNYSNFEMCSNMVGIDYGFETENIGIYFENLHKKFLFNQLWNKIYRADIIKKNNILFDVDKSIAEDWEFNIKYLSKCNRMKHIDSILYNYRVTNTGLGFRYRTDSNYIKFEILKLMSEVFKERGIKNSFLDICYIIQIFSFLSVIMDSRNKETFRKKYNLIEQFVNSEEYSIILCNIFVEKKRYKIMLFLLKTKIVWITCLLGIIANKYDKYKKRKIFGIKGEK